jgi:hypothetical protein
VAGHYGRNNAPLEFDEWRFAAIQEHLERGLDGSNRGGRKMFGLIAKNSGSLQRTMNLQWILPPQG